MLRSLLTLCGFENFNRELGILFLKTDIACGYSMQYVTEISSAMGEDHPSECQLSIYLKFFVS